MKTVLHFFIFFVLFISVGCSKEAIGPESNQTVDLFVNQLKEGSYTSMKLPAFSSFDIQHYLNTEMNLLSFLISLGNPLSSYYLNECRLGLYILWVIESIRVGSDNSKIAFFDFYSMNPVLLPKSSIERPQTVNSEYSHQIAADAYSKWWKDNEGKAFNRFRTKDPLLKTDFRWK